MLATRSVCPTHTASTAVVLIKSESCKSVGRCAEGSARATIADDVACAVSAATFGKLACSIQSRLRDSIAVLKVAQATSLATSPHPAREVDTPSATNA